MKRGKGKSRDDDSDEKLKNNNHELMRRKEKRRSVQDNHRPNLHDSVSSGSDTIIFDENENDDWLDEDDYDFERTVRQKSSSKHDQSLEYVKQFEDNQKRQQKMRRRSFNSNRRNSSMKLKTEIVGSTSSNDFDKYQSCLSLRSVGSFSEDFTQSRFKKLTQNFIHLHVDQVSRLSDIYVPQRRQKVAPVDDKSFWDLNWKDVTKPMPIIIITLLTIAFLALASFILNSRDKLKI